MLPRKQYLIQSGVSSDHIIMLALDSVANAKYRNPLELDQYIRSQIAHDGKRYYVFIDEIQFVMNIQNPYVDHKEARITFVDVVIGLMELPDVDTYITGSNSHMLSSDILTQFRDRADEIRVYIHCLMQNSMTHMKRISAMHGRSITPMAGCQEYCQ